MADDFLFFKFHLRERSCFAIWHKKRIVAKAHVADGSVVDFATAFAFKNDWLADDKFTIFVFGYSLVRKCAKITCLAVFDAFELLHQFDVVGFVVAMLAAVAGAVNAGFAIQGKNLEPGIVGENGRFDVSLGEPLSRCVRLDYGVLGKRVAIFNNVSVKTDVF